MARGCYHLRPLVNEVKEVCYVDLDLAVRVGPVHLGVDEAGRDEVRSKGFGNEGVVQDTQGSGCAQSTVQEGHEPVVEVGGQEGLGVQR